MTTETLTWETASDWDNAQSDSGVWHRNSTDASAGNVRGGCEEILTELNASLMYLDDESAGASSLADYAGTNDATTYNSIGSVSDGPNGFSALSFNSSNSEYATTPYVVPRQSDFAVIGWFRLTDSSSPFLSGWNGSSPTGATLGSPGYEANTPSGAVDMAIRDINNGDNDHIYTDTTGWNDGTWHLGIWERTYGPSNGADQMDIWIDGSQQTYTIERSQTCDDLGTDQYYLGHNGWATDAAYSDADLGPIAVVGRTLTTSEKDSLWDARNSGSLTTARKVA